MRQKGGRHGNNKDSNNAGTLRRMRQNSNMQAVNDTFSEVYDNMETLDGRIDALEHKTDAAYLGNCYCGSVYLGYVSETDT